MAELEKSTITIKTAAAVSIAAVGMVVNFLTTRYALQMENQDLRYEIKSEAKERERQDGLMAKDIASNRRDIERLESAIKPSTVTTYR